MNSTTAAFTVSLVLVSSSLLAAQGVVLELQGGLSACASIDDLDGDSRPEVLVSQITAWGPDEVRLYSGASGALMRSHTSSVQSGQFGRALCAVGDVDLDGKCDYAIGAPGALMQVVEVRSGASGAVIRTHAAPAGYEHMGASLAGRGDVDGDGIAELLVGSPSAFLGSSGAAYVFSGATGALLRTHTSSAGTAADFGTSVAFVGDVDGDALADYAVGDPRASSDLIGSVTVFSGASGAQLYTRGGSGGADAFGFALAAMGDIDGDARAELVVGAPAHTWGMWHTGQVYVCSGATGAMLRQASQNYGVSFGRSVAGLGDFDGDNVPDFASLVPLVYVGGVLKNFGRAHVHSGATGASSVSATFGFAGPLAHGGDFNLDGAADLIVAGGVNDSGAFIAQIALGSAPLAIAYCSPKTNSAGCVSWPSASGGASASIGADLTISATQLIPNTQGLFFWSLAPAAVPFSGGTMCVASPRVRMPPSSSSGTIGCSGRLATTWSKPYLAANGLSPGSVFYVQAWTRDPGFASPSNLGLSGGIQVTIWP